MYITDLRPNRVVDDLELHVVEVREPREVVTKYGKESRVAVAVAEDDKGNQVNLSLWDGEIERVEVGMRVRITNGWARTFQDELQVSAGLHGKLSIVS
jgi:uncharacterized OB-fold protein